MATTTRDHVRNTFLAGIFAAIPLALTGWIFWQVDLKTRDLCEWVIGRRVPFLGILIAILGIYALGMMVNSLLGKLVLRVIDTLLLRIPGLKHLYVAWKQVALTPGGTEGMFAHVVLIPIEGNLRTLAFTSGRSLEGDATTCCVFVPAAPNPTSGRLYFVKVADCIAVEVSTEEAFKMILSGGNFIPAGVSVVSSPLSVVED